MNVQVSFEGDVKKSFRLTLWTTVGDLKGMISKEIKIPENQIQILYFENQLLDSMPLTCFSSFFGAHVTLECKIMHSKNTFTQEEEDALFAYWLIYKNNWSKIERYIPTKTKESTIKYWETELAPKLIASGKITPDQFINAKQNDSIYLSENQMKNLEKQFQFPQYSLQLPYVPPNSNEFEQEKKQKGQRGRKTKQSKKNDQLSMPAMIQQQITQPEQQMTYLSNIYQQFFDQQNSPKIEGRRLKKESKNSQSNSKKYQIYNQSMQIYPQFQQIPYQNIQYPTIPSSFPKVTKQKNQKKKQTNIEQTNWNERNIRKKDENDKNQEDDSEEEVVENSQEFDESVQYFGEENAEKGNISQKGISDIDNLSQSMEPWTEEEDKLLNEKYDLYGAKWAKIKEFFPNRTAKSLFNRWHIKNREHQRIIATWTPEEDSLIIEKLREFGPKWGKIATFFPQKNARVLREYWQKSLRPRVVQMNSEIKWSNGGWCPDDDELLTKLISEHGYDWKLISSRFPLRTIGAIRSHWLSAIKPKLVAEKRTEYVHSSTKKKDLPWSLNEEKKLIRKVHEIGKNWKALKVFFPGRSCPSIHTKWLELKLKAERGDMSEYGSCANELLNSIKQENKQDEFDDEESEGESYDDDYDE